MANDDKPKPNAAYPPKKPEKGNSTTPLRPSRRQVLTGLLSGGAVFGCSSADESSSLDGGGGTSSGGNTSGGDASPGGSTSSSGGSAASSGGRTNSGGGTASGGTTNSGGARASGGTTNGGSAQGSGGEEPDDVEDGAGGAEATSTRNASDQVPLGATGIMVSRLAMGSGSTGFDGSSKQTKMGEEFTKLLVDSFDLGINFWETADAYGSHAQVGEAMRQVGRENVVLMTKTTATSKSRAEEDIARFMDELGTDYIDVLLLHIRESGDWTNSDSGAMEALEDAKAAGMIGAHGVSCHTYAALQQAADTDWTDVHLSRINPFELHMDGSPDTIISFLEAEKAKGRGIIGMKILAQGDAVDRYDQCMEHATRLDALDCFTMGFASRSELDQAIAAISAVNMG